MKSCTHWFLIVSAVSLVIVAGSTKAAATNYTISVSVNGLSGTLVVQDDKGDTLTFTASKTQTFATSYASGSTYSVTVKTQPTGQTCTLGKNSSGTIRGNITVTASCSSSYTISVAATGLTGTLVVQDNKGDSLTFTSNNTQTFATTYPGGTGYSVTVKTQPNGQTCTLSSNSKGTITSNITVTASCSGGGYTISVAVTGLTGTLVVQDSPTDLLTFTTNDTQTFGMTYASGASYSVAIKSQPVGQTCTLSSNASGTITSNLTVTATCTNEYTISVAVSGLVGTLVVQDGASDTLTFTQNGTKTFSKLYTSGESYAVLINSQPSGQTCTLSSNGTGIITASITVNATCTNNDKISVAVTGLSGTLVVQDDKSDTLTFTTNNTQTFATSYTNGSTYSVTIKTQPTGQTCTLSSNASGTISANVTVTATCSGANYTLSVAVASLAGTLVMEDDQSKTLTFTTNITQSFSNTYAYGASYTVSVKTQPPGQTCNVGSNASGTITSNVTVTVVCTILQSFFGADFIGSNIWPPTDGLGNVATLGGMRLWGGNVEWAQLNPADTTYDWTNMDTWIAEAQSESWDVLYTFGDTPQWAGSIPAGNPCLVAAGPYSCSPPTDLNADGTGADAYFSNFVTALVTRYKGEIAYYELWDEPDCTCYWAGTTAQIVRMGQDAAAIIRSIDPNARILSPSAHGPTMATWFDGYIAAGGAANFDIVNAHMRGAGTLYPNAVPESFLAMYNDVIAETTKRSLTALPLWDDEHGIKTNQLTDPDELAGYVARSAILRAGVGLQRQYVYTWDEGDIYGLQGNKSGTAWDVVAGWLIGHSINACVATGTVYTCAVDNGQIVWDTAQSCSNGVCTYSNYTYPSIYAWESDISGDKTPLTPPTVQIGYKPILLTSK